jgi:hypothetical protein
MRNEVVIESAAAEPVSAEQRLAAPVPLSDEELNELLDEALRETFPASDPIAVSRHS